MQFPNVHYQQQNALHFEELLEKDYLMQALEGLQQNLGKQFDQIQFIIYSNNGTSNWPLQLEELPKGEKQVLIYLSDETGAIPEVLKPEFDLIFKCYLPVDHTDNVFALPLGVPLRAEGQRPTTSGRQHQVFFSGQLHYNRQAFFSWIADDGLDPHLKVDEFYQKRSYLIGDYSARFQNARIEFTEGFRKGLDFNAYQDLMKNSQVALCPEGYKSHETFRHFEALQSGAIPISKPLPDVFYYRGAPIYQVEEWAMVDGLLETLFQNPEHAMQIQKKALQWWENVCSPHAIATYMADRIQRVVPA